MKPGDRVRFIGPEYKHTQGIRIGQEGTIQRRDGHYAQMIGQEKEEIICVLFDGDERNTNLSINRIEGIR